MDRTLLDLNLNGIGSAAGGEYRHVRLDGACKLLSDVSAETFVVNGHGSAQGAVRTKQFTCNGKFTIKGALNSEEVRIDGMVDTGSVNADRVTANGGLSSEGDVESELFELTGYFDVEGLLNAGTIKISLHGGSRAREIGGEIIRVRKGKDAKWNKLVSWAIPRLNVQLEANVIEGDDIELEETVAAVVRGNRVVIGKGCRIGKVEHKGELVVHPQAKVDERVRN